MTDPAAGDGLTPQLFAGHIVNEHLEVNAREICAHILQTVRQVLSNAIFPALDIVAIERSRARESIRVASNQIPWDKHFASHGCGNVA
jgi:hypothetical protein